MDILGAPFLSTLYLYKFTDHSFKYANLVYVSHCAWLMNVQYFTAIRTI